MPKRILEGVVVSDKGDKTVVVKVERTILHPVLKKTVRRSKKYHAHDETNAYKAGEIARIVECAPKSKLKRWQLVRVVSKSQAVDLAALRAASRRRGGDTLAEELEGPKP
jgi:small subunit ribosomal protein S17